MLGHYLSMGYSHTCHVLHNTLTSGSHLINQPNILYAAHTYQWAILCTVLRPVTSSSTLILRFLVACAAYAPLPYAFAHLGWPAGIIFLGLAGLVTWYTSLLLASLERHDGRRHMRYCDLAGSIYGEDLQLLAIAALPLLTPAHGMSNAGSTLLVYIILYGYRRVILFEST